LKETAIFLSKVFIAISIAVLSLVLPSSESQDSVLLEPLFIQAFGERLRLDPQKVREALDAPPGVVIKVDEDGDGGTDAMYFVDRDPRHLEKYRPIVVKALAPDGNFTGGQLNMAHVLLVADWHGDARIDRLVAHLDDDGDGDIDRQLVASPWHDYFGPLHLVLAEDIGDDNGLWYHRNYWTDIETYWWRSDFNGDEAFHFFTFDPARQRWIQKGEGPFAFYDNDKDGFADEIVRRDTTLGENMASLRWSFDIDRDANPFQPHDYDFSFSSFGPLDVPELLQTRTRIGLAETGGYLPWDKARTWVREAPWKACMLTWDEADNNIDMQTSSRSRDGDFYIHEGWLNERWEGVLNFPTEAFPQVGGPSAGPFQRRIEVDLDNSGRMGLYFSPVDRRIHLQGAEFGFQKIDFDLDQKMDMAIRMGDRNGDGYFDAWEVDLNADGAADLSYGYLDRMSRNNNVPHEGIPGDMTSFYREQRRKGIDDNLVFIQVMRDILEQKESRFHMDEAERFFRDRLRAWQPEYGHGEKMHASLDTELLYSDIIRLRYFGRILMLEPFDVASRGELLKLYWSGDYGLTGKWLRGHFSIPAAPEKEKGFLVSIRNRTALKLWRHPVLIDLRMVLPGQKLLPNGLTVWDSVPHLDPLPLPSQSDDLNGDGWADELAFIADFMPGEIRTFRLELQKTPFPQGGTRTSENSEPWGWETGNGRFTWRPGEGIWYAGKAASLFDGRVGSDPDSDAKAERKILDLPQLAAIGGTSGLILVSQGPIRTILRSSKHPLFLIGYAEHPFSEIRWSGDKALRVKLNGTDSGSLRETTDMKIWEQWDGDLGTAALWPKDRSYQWDGRHRVLTIEPAGTTARFWISGYWRSGDRFPYLPSRSNWFHLLDRLALVFSSPMPIEKNDSEQLSIKAASRAAGSGKGSSSSSRK